MAYVNLRGYTTASMDCGLFNIENAIEKIKSNPEEYSSAFAITEKNNMYSIIDFYKHGQKASNDNFKFNSIVGIDLTFSKEKELTYKIQENNTYREEVKIQSQKYSNLLLAKNNNGYYNLCKIQTLFFKSKNEDRVTENVAFKNAELFKDLFALSGGNGGYLFNKFKELNTTTNKDSKEEYLNDIKKHILFWKELTNNNYFIELQRDGTEFENEYIKFILPISIELGVPVVATNNTYFVNKEDYFYNEMLSANINDTNVFINKNLTLNQSHKATPENYLKSNSEMKELFSDIPIALNNSLFIEKECNVSFELNKHNYLPEIKSPNPNESIDDFFRRLSNEGLDEIMLLFFEKYGDNNNFENQNYPDNNYFQKFKELRDLNIDTRFLSNNEKLDILKKTNIYKEYKDRLDTEIEIIVKMKFPSYFLVVADFIQWSKENEIPVGPGRGSGAGSLVAYALKITSVDPLQFGLLFERFLNPDRVSMPDFDIDFSTANRNKVIQYVQKKYNKKDQIAVAKIMNVSRYETLASIEVAASCYGIKNNHPFVKSMKQFFDTKKQKTDEIEEDSDFDEEMDGNFFDVVKTNKEFQINYKNTKMFKDILNLASKIYKGMRTVSVHASGIVIASQSIDDILPLTKIQKSNVTQLNKDNSEALGVVKFDFLALENLDIIQHTLEEINKTRKINNLNSISIYDLNDLNIYDPNVYKNIFQTGNTIDVFQFASSGMRKMLKSYKPDCFEDLVALVSLYRPGPMSIIPDYIATKHGQKSIVNIAPSNPKVLEILKETYGFIVYQEQIMQIAMEYAGYSLGQADLLRRAMGKKKPEEMAKHRGIFLEGALRLFIKENKINDEELESIKSKLIHYSDLNKFMHEVSLSLHNESILKQIKESMNLYDKMESFANYGFNKSHAAAYAMISFQTAYLKHYYPHEYFMAVLHSHVDNKKDKATVVAETLNDAKENNIEILDIHINHSNENFYLNKDKKLVMPLLLMTDMNVLIAKNIRQTRSKVQRLSNNENAYDSTALFIKTMSDNGMPINKKTLINLIRVGAFKNLNNKESDKFFIENAINIINFFEQQKVKIVNPLLKHLPTSMIKDSIKRKKTQIEFKKVNPLISMEEELIEIDKVLKFIPDISKIKKLAILNKETLSLFKNESNQNLFNITSTMNNIEYKLKTKIEEIKEKFIEEQNNSQNPENVKLSLFSAKSTDIVNAYVLDVWETKYNINLKLVTENGIIEVVSRNPELKKDTLKKFTGYYFILDSYINRDFNPFESNELPIEISLKDYFPIANLCNQIVEKAEIKFENGIFNDKSDEEKSEYIKNIINKVEVEENDITKDNDEEVEIVDKKEQPLTVVLPNKEEFEIDLNSTLYEKLSKENIFIDIKLNSDALNHDNKIIIENLNGNITEFINVNEMLDKINNNETFNQFNESIVLATAKSLESDIMPKNYEHAIFGYIKEIKNFKNGTNLIFIDNSGTEFNIADKNNLMKKYKTNEPAIVKINYARSSKGGHFYTLKDIYFEKDIYDLNQKQNGLYVNSQSRNDLIEVLTNNNIKFNQININDLDYDNAIKIHFKNENTKIPFFESIIIKIDENVHNKDEIFKILKTFNPQSLFDFNREIIDVINMPSANSKGQSLYDNVNNYINYMNNNYKYNWLFIENKMNTGKFTDRFTKVELLNRSDFALANDNKNIMICVMVNKIEENGNNKFISFNDDTGEFSCRLSGEEKFFDFKQQIELKEPVILKIKLSKSKKVNDLTVYKNIQDIYTMEEGVKVLADKIFINGNNDLNHYEKIEEIVKEHTNLKDKNKPSPFKTIEIVIKNSENSQNKAPLIVEYSDNLYNEMMSKLKITEKEIFLSINHNVGIINDNKFPNILQNKIIEDKFGKKDNESRKLKNPNTMKP